MALTSRKDIESVNVMKELSLGSHIYLVGPMKAAPVWRLSTGGVPAEPGFTPNRSWIITAPPWIGPFGPNCHPKELKQKPSFTEKLADYLPYECQGE